MLCKLSNIRPVKEGQCIALSLYYAIPYHSRGLRLRSVFTRFLLYGAAPGVWCSLTGTEDLDQLHFGDFCYDTHLILQTHTHTHRCLPVTHTGVTPLSTGADANCVCLVCVCVSISSLETHFSSELVTLCQKSANKVFCSDLSRNAAAPAFIFVWWELRKEKRSPPHTKLHNHCAACKWLASIVLAVSDISVKDITLKQSGSSTGPCEAVDYHVYMVAWQFNSLAMRRRWRLHLKWHPFYYSSAHTYLCSKTHRLNTRFSKTLSYYR